MRAFHILIVDDDPIARTALAALMRKLGFTNVDQAVNGFEALRLLISRQYDLIFLDNLMPVMSGLEFLRRCKCGGILDGSAVVMITTAADTTTIKAIRDEKLKMDDFIIKPLERTVIAAKVDRLLQSGKTAPTRRLIDPSALPEGVAKGQFLSITTESRGGSAAITLFGFFLNDDRQFVKDLPDAIAGRAETTIALDLSNVLMIDEFGLGMLLLINGVATLAGKRLGMVLDELTIKNRLVGLGLSRIIPVLEAAPEAGPDQRQVLPGHFVQRAADLG